MQVVEVTGMGNVEFPDDMSHEDIIHAIEKDILPPPQTQEELPDRSLADYAKDIATTGAKAVIGVDQVAVGIADLLPGVNPGKFLEEHGVDFNKMQKQLSDPEYEYFSPQHNQEVQVSKIKKQAQSDTGYADGIPLIIVGLIIYFVFKKSKKESWKDNKSDFTNGHYSNSSHYEKQEEQFTGSSQYQKQENTFEERVSELKDNILKSYEILEVDQNASPSDIKNAFKKKMSRYHPDKVSGLGDKLQQVAEEETKLINVAYQNLKKAGKC
ncbi:MAG: J domain-containing protein [Methylococcales bacterium]|nr:J domain-containing protein [Methylococcales bacterium]